MIAVRVVPRSIHGRLVLLALFTLLIAQAIGGITITRLSQSYRIAAVDRQIYTNLSLLACFVDDQGHVDTTRLGRLRRGWGGGLGWGWRITAPELVIGSPHFPVLDTAAAARGAASPIIGEHKPRIVEGRDQQGRGIRAGILDIATPQGMVELTASAPHIAISPPMWGSISPLLVTWMVIAAMFTIWILAQLELGLRPLRRLSDDVASIRSGRASAIDENLVVELRPLAIELNALMRDNAAALEAARASAANLAHALKTPIATLALDLIHNPAQTAQIARIDTTIRHHLARARSIAIDKRAEVALAPLVEDLAVTIAKIHKRRQVHFDIDLDADLIVAVAASDIEEIVGNVIDNAARFATSEVRIRAATRRSMIWLTISDDGPGIAAEDRSTSLKPGVRLDERGSGHGFGLAIASDLVQLYGGELILDEAAAGGLAVAIGLPVARR